MRSYELPPTSDVTDAMTVAEARQVLEAINADCIEDSQHPLVYRNHPQYQTYADFSTRLHTIVAQAKADEQAAREAEQIEAVKAGPLPEITRLAAAGDGAGLTVALERALRGLAAPRPILDTFRRYAFDATLDPAAREAALGKLTAWIGTAHETFRAKLEPSTPDEEIADDADDELS